MEIIVCKNIIIFFLENRIYKTEERRKVIKNDNLFSKSVYFRNVKKKKYFPSNGDEEVGARGRLPRFSSFFATNRERKKRFTADVRERGRVKKERRKRNEA